MSRNNPTTGTTPGTPTAGGTTAGITAGIDPRLKDFLDLINGTDAYDARTIAVGKLSPGQFLQIPHGIKYSVPDPTATGKSTAASGLTADEFAQVYVMNKLVFGTDERACKIGLIRAYAVSLGWYTGSYEVNIASPPADYADIMLADFDLIQRHTEVARTLASLLPFASEFVFRTMGHHYLTGLGPEYEAKYQKFFNACVQPTLTSYLAPVDLYHTALHWVSLGESYSIASSEDAQEWLPNAVVIRAKAAPAGTALVATSVAILNAMAGTGLKQAMIDHSGVDIAKLEEVASEITTNPGKYHTIPSAYGKKPLANDKKEEFEKAKEVALKLAPVLQGFLDSLPNNSTLAQAKALAKHADANPLQRRRAKVFFREVGTTKAATIEELFAGDKRSQAATKEEVVDEDED